MKESFYQTQYKQVYLQSDHWRKLNEKLIDTEKRAKCWICWKKNSLLIHHISYKNLYKERLGKDIYILCYDCHSQVHFYQFMKFWTKRTKMKRNNLFRRMVYLRIIHVYRNKRFGLIPWYLFRYTFAL